jgi:hypothetical protein
MAARDIEPAVAEGELVEVGHQDIGAVRRIALGQDQMIGKELKT